MTSLRLKWAGLAAFCALAGACVNLPDGGPGAHVYRFSAAKALPDLDPDRFDSRLHVARPVASAALDGDRIAIAVSPTEVAYLKEALWAEPPTRMLRALVADAFERSGLEANISTAGDGARESYVLHLVMREFAAEKDGPGARAHIRTAARIVSRDDRRLVAARVFDTQGAARSDAAEDVVSAFDAAAEELVNALVRWSYETVSGDRAEASELGNESRTR